MTDQRNYDLVPGFGSVFVKYLDQESCTRAIRAINGVYYGDKIVQCGYWTEEWFNLGKFEAPPEIEQQEMGKEFEGLANLPIEFQEERKSQPIKVGGK